MPFTHSENIRIPRASLILAHQVPLTPPVELITGVSQLVIQHLPTRPEQQSDDVFPLEFALLMTTELARTPLRRPRP